MTLGILTAMSVEYEQLARMMTNAHRVDDGPVSYLEGDIAGKHVVLQQCGIGKVNAAVGATLMIRRYHPDYVVSTGVAGGIDPTLSVMDVVVSTRIVYHDVWCGPGNEYGQIQGLPLYFEGDQKLVQAATNIQTGVNIVAGLICTGDKFITDRAELDAIKSAFPEGMAVDMESASIAQVCKLLGVPFVSFRIISDTPGADKHLQQYANFWGDMADRSFHVTKAFIENIA